MFLIIVLALILGSAVQMGFDRSVTVTRSFGVTVVRTVVEWATIFPCLLIAKAIEKARENIRAVVCVLVALAAVVGIFLACYSLQVKTWKEEAKKDQVGFASADWRLARLRAREARGNPCFYESVLGLRTTLKWHRDQVLVLREVMGTWDRWDAFDVTPDGVASWVCQRDIPNR